MNTGRLISSTYTKVWALAEMDSDFLLKDHALKLRQVVHLLLFFLDRRIFLFCLRWKNLCPYSKTCFWYQTEAGNAETSKAKIKSPVPLLLIGILVSKFSRDARKLMYIYEDAVVDMGP